MLYEPRFPIVTLAAHHDVHAFSCGSRKGAAEINEYLRTNALAEQQAGLASVRIAIDATTTPRDKIVAFFTLSPLTVPISSTVLELMGLDQAPYRSVGGYLLGRLGVDVAYQGKGLGLALVAAAIKLAKAAQRDAGGAFLAIDPKNDELLRWYERLDFGFRRLNTTDPARRRLLLRL